MLRKNITYFRGANFLLDVCLTLLSLFLAAELYRSVRAHAVAAFSLNIVNYRHAILVTLIWGTIIYLRGDHYVYRLKNVRDFAREAVTLASYGGGVFVIGCYLLRQPLMPRGQLAAFLIIDFAALFTLRLTLLKTLHYFRARGFNSQQTLVVGTRERARQVVDAILENPQWGLRPAGIIVLEAMPSLYRYRDIPLVGDINELAGILRVTHVDNVIFSVPDDHLHVIKAAVRVCEQAGVKVCLQADFIKSTASRYKSGEFAGKPAIIYSREPEASLPILIKAASDRIAGLVGLVLMLPLMVIIAAAIRLTSKGPVFFRQVRCGLNGRRFRLLKFRTMVDGAEGLKSSLRDKNEMDGPVFKIKNDPRTTPVGRVLRKLSLDELPQLLNVVRGDMSLVGPRPPLPEEVKEYDLWQRRRLSMKPGITCLWQVGKRNDTTFEEWMKQDLDYIDNWSLWLDAKVLARTIPTVIRATGR